MVDFSVKEVETFRGNTVVSVAEFNGGESHIVADGSCWVIMNNGNFTPWISKEALGILKLLPPLPKHYGPLQRFLGRMAIMN